MALQVDPAFVAFLRENGFVYPDEQSLSITAPELAPPIIGSLPPGNGPGQMPAPAPAPSPAPTPAPMPPVQKLGPDEQIEETAPPRTPEPPAIPPMELPHFADAFDANFYAAMQPQPEPTPELVPVGSGLDAFGMEKIPAAQPEQTFDPLSPSTWASPPAPELAPVGHQRTSAGEGEQSLSLAEYLALDPLSRAKYDAEQEQRVADFANQRTADIQKTDAARAEQAERAYLDSQERATRVTEAALADAEALANEKPKKFMDSIGNVVGTVIGVLLGQLGSDATGGKNVGLEVALKRMDDFAQEQINEYNRKAGNIDRRLNIAARLREAGYNEYQTKQVIRMAGLQRLRAQLLTDVQNFDPRGTAARNIGKHLLAVDGQMRANAEALRRQNLEDEIKLTDLASKKLDVAMKEAKLRGIGAGAGGKHAPEFFEQRGLRRPPVPMTEKDYSAWLKTKKLDEDLTKTEQEVVAGRSQGMSKEEAERGVAGLKQKDGSPFIAQGTPESVNELRKRVESTKFVVRVLDQIDRTRTGWSPDITKSDEWKQLKTDWAAAKGVSKDVLGLGALSGPDEALIEAFLSGGIDPTGMRDPGPGIERARMNIINLTRDSLEGRGFDGKFDIPKPKLSAAVESPSDARYKLAQKTPTLTDVIEASGGKADGRQPAELYAPFVAPGEAPDVDNVVLPQVRREIDALAQAAKNGDEEAIEKLSALAFKKGGNTGTRKAAEAALINAGRTPESFEDVTGQRQQTARETIPPPRAK